MNPLMKYILLVATFLLLNSFRYSQIADSLKVVYWNVFLRPGILKDKQLMRVDSIASKLLKVNADVIRYRSSHIEEPRCFFEKKRTRISDHNPIITVFDW